jgi:hypothetical protein
MGNYLMPCKDVEKKMFIALQFLFRSRCVETVNNKCMIHYGTVLCVYSWPAYWETDTAVVSEQMVQLLLM